MTSLPALPSAVVAALALRASTSLRRLDSLPVGTAFLFDRTLADGRVVTWPHRRGGRDGLAVLAVPVLGPDADPAFDLGALRLDASLAVATLTGDGLDVGTGRDDVPRFTL